MDEKNIEDKDIINIENQQESQNNLLDKPFNNRNEEINNKESLNNSIKKEEVDEDNNNMKANEIITNEEVKEQIVDNINNNELNENINNFNNINTNDFFPFQLNPPLNNKKLFDYDKNLSKEQKEEQIENNLRKLLSELSNIKEQGNNYYNNKNYELAEQKYKEGIQKIDEFSILPNLEELNDKIKEHIININIFHSKFYNNLSTVLFKQKKYEESIKTAEYIIQNINKDHDVSYCRILYCLIELKKIMLANHYAEIIKKKFRNKESIDKFKEQFDRLEKLNKEFSNNLLNSNPELKKEIISMNNNKNNNIDNNIINKIDEEKEEENENNFTKYLPYIIGGFAFLLIGGRFLYKRFNSK